MSRVLMPYPLDAVTIIGLGASCYDLVSFQHDKFDFPPGHETWTINAGGLLFRHDLLWDMHTEEYLADYRVKEAAKHAKIRETWQGSSPPSLSDPDRTLRRRKWLETHDRPIMMARAVDSIPQSHTYPLKHVIETLRSSYFLTSSAYVIAFALLCGVKCMRLYGFDFSYSESDDNERNEPGRPCAEYWIGRAIERGVRVEVTSNTLFLGMNQRAKGKLYGYHEPATFDFPKGGGLGRFVGPDYS